MSGFDQLVNGFAIALSWKGLLYCFIGCFWGTIVGVLPGLGPLAGMTLLLPPSPASTATRWRAAGAPGRL